MNAQGTFRPGEVVCWGKDQNGRYYIQDDCKYYIPATPIKNGIMFFIKLVAPAGERARCGVTRFYNDGVIHTTMNSWYDDILHNAKITKPYERIPKRTKEVRELSTR